MTKEKQETKDTSQNTKHQGLIHKDIIVVGLALMVQNHQHIHHLTMRNLIYMVISKTRKLKRNLKQQTKKLKICIIQILKKLSKNMENCRRWYEREMVFSSNVFLIWSVLLYLLLLQFSFRCGIWVWDIINAFRFSLFYS